MTNTPNEEINVRIGESLDGYGPCPGECKEHCPVCGTATERMGPEHLQGEHSWVWKCMSCESSGMRDQFGKVNARMPGGTPIDPDTGEKLEPGY